MKHFNHSLTLYFKLPILIRPCDEFVYMMTALGAYLKKGIVFIMCLKSMCVLCYVCLLVAKVSWTTVQRLEGTDASPQVLFMTMTI